MNVKWGMLMASKKRRSEVRVQGFLGEI